MSRTNADRSAAEARTEPRRPHGLLATIVVLALVAAACAQTSSPPTTSAAPGSAAPSVAASPTPRPGGTLTFGASFTPASPLDMRTATLASGWGIGLQIYESLYRPRVEGGVDPGLAEKTVISPDGLTVTLTLRAGVKFHDGTDFDAAAVKTNLDLRKAHPTFPFKAQLAPIKEVKVVDAKTVQLLMSQPSASLTTILSIPAFGMQSPTAMAKYVDRAEYAKNAAGTAPFKLESATDTEFRFVRFEGYWGQKAYLDRLVIKVITDTGAQLASLEAGDITVLDNVIASERARLAQNAKLTVFATPIAEQPVDLYFNTGKGFTADKNVRQAIIHGLNRPSYVGVGPGLVDPADSIVPPNSLGYVKQTPYPYDAAKAKQMLTAAGVQAGLAVEIAVLTSTYTSPLAQLIKQDLDKLGFQTTIRLMDSAAWTAFMSTSLADSKWQLSMSAPGTQYADAESTLLRLLASVNDAPKGNNWVHWKNAAFDDLLAKQSAAVDAAARAKLLADAQKLAWDEAPIAPLLFAHRLIVTQKAVRGLESFGSGVNRYTGVWLAP